MEWEEGAVAYVRFGEHGDAPFRLCKAVEEGGRKIWEGVDTGDYQSHDPTQVLPQDAALRLERLRAALLGAGVPPDVVKLIEEGDR